MNRNLSASVANIVARIGPCEAHYAAEAQRRLDSLTKPIGSLGRLEGLAAKMFAIFSGEVPLPLRRGVYVFAADHGVTAEGVSAYPREVTAQMVHNFVTGGAGINALARVVGARVVVVDMGTATVFDVVSAKGEYLGGAIAPGVAISLEALYSQASALRSVELVRPRSVIGRSTVESIQSGVLYGFAAQVDGVVERILEELGEATVIATGGLAGLIAPHTKHVQHVEPWLTLHGLRIVHERNHSGDTS